jgi:hypothetical protein
VAAAYLVALNQPDQAHHHQMMANVGSLSADQFAQVGRGHLAVLGQTYQDS